MRIWEQGSLGLLFNILSSLKMQGTALVLAEQLILRVDLISPRKTLIACAVESQTGGHVQG